MTEDSPAGTEGVLGGTEGRPGGIGETPDGPRAVRTWAAVPYRGESGKQRLAGLLSDVERVRVVAALLGDVLDALVAVPAIARILVVAPAGTRLPDEVDPRAVVLGERYDGDARRPVGLNPALRRAQVEAVAASIDRLLIVPADLPLLAPDDVEALLRATRAGPATLGVVIAPDRAAGGTNALLLAPPAALAPMFGMRSFARHVAQAAGLDLPCIVVRRPGFELDLDTPADVAHLLRVSQSGRTLALARALRLDERLGLMAGGR